MRSFGFRLMFLVGIVWAGIGSTVWALGHHDRAVEAVYVVPSSLTLPVPTSYVVSTSRVEPTAYVVPTYYTTAYWMDPVVLAQPTYAPTAYVRRGGLFGRRWVVEEPVLATYTTSYVASAFRAAPAYRTSSYVLTDRLVVPSAYIAATDCVCPPMVASAAPIYATPSRGAGSAVPGGGSAARARQSQPEAGDSMSSEVGAPPRELSPLHSGAIGGENTRTGGDNTPSPPKPTTPPGRPPATGAAGGNVQGGQRGQGGETAAPPGPGQGRVQDPAGGGQAQSEAALKNQAGQKSDAASQKGSAQPAAPTAPGGLDQLPVPPPIDTPADIRRDSLRPNYASPAPRTRYPNILIGTVLSADGQREEGVRIVVRNAATGGTKTTTTNAFGRFAVKVSDGDWAVDVTMPSGRVYEVSQLRVADGVITDNEGRRVPSLEITR